MVQGKKEVAKALRVFVDHTNYPVLVHCIHGKDRTGLIVMLIMLLCSVEPEVRVSHHLFLASGCPLPACYQPGHGNAFLKCISDAHGVF